MNKILNEFYEAINAWKVFLGLIFTIVAWFLTIGKFEFTLSLEHKNELKIITFKQLW